MDAEERFNPMQLWGSKSVVMFQRSLNLSPGLHMLLNLTCIVAAVWKVGIWVNINQLYHLRVTCSDDIANVLMRNLIWRHSVVIFSKKIRYMNGFLMLLKILSFPLQWLHNERDGVLNHQLHDYLLNRLFKAQIKETSKLRVTGLCEGISTVTGELPHKGPVTQKMFPFDDVIMPWIRVID